MNHTTYAWVANINESCIISHVAYEWVTPHMHAPRLWSRHASCVTSQMNEPPHKWMSHEYDRVLYNWSCHIWMSHTTYAWVVNMIVNMIEACIISGVTYEWVTPHINESRLWTSHVSWLISHMSESHHIWMSHISWVMSHMSKSHLFLMGTAALYRVCSTGLR